MVRVALKRPITILVIFIGLLMFSIIAIRGIPIDIFPKLNSPTIYVIESYGGMSPQQMEGFFSTRMQDQFLYVNGIKNIESKNIQGLTLIKLSFYENTDMAEASAQVALQVNRASKFFPPGALPPQVIRFDASSLPVGQLVFSSKTKSLKEIYDVVATRIRPLFASVPGLSAPPPFGANSRSVVVSVDPEKLRRFNISPDQVVEAIAKNNAMTPSGNIRIDNLMFLTTVNSLEEKVKDFEDIPIISNGASAVFIHDMATVADAADVTVDYALINGKRSVYMPVVVQKAVNDLGTPPKVLIAQVRGMSSLLTETLGSLQTGLLVAVAVILLLLAANYQSFGLSISVLATVPAVILGAMLLLLATGSTLNLQSYMGIIMAVGVSVANAILIVTNAETLRLEYKNPFKAATVAAGIRLRPILMTSLAMIAGMIPMASGMGEAGDQSAPLGRAVIGGLAASTFAALFIVPLVYGWIQQKSTLKSVSLLPEDSNQ
jgi:multidrug efflux pump subunit AcrB